jgi:hypothetical protein
MKLLARFLLVCFTFFSCNEQQLFAGNGSANSTGNWSNPSTWLFNGSPRIPVEGDTVFIPAGITVTVATTVTYLINGTPMGVNVHGTLAFQTGKKLSLPCLSFVNVYQGGTLDPGTGGGNSNYIEVCGTTEWTAADGPVSGPASFGNSTFPIELLNFTGRYSSEKIFLDWTTAAEVNNNYFLIQRADNNQEYQDIVRMEGSGTTSELHYYSAVDNHPLTGINYYRLCQVDFDGSRTFSEPIAVKADGSKDIFVFPNPATADNIALFSSATKNQSIELMIADANGKIIFNNSAFILHPGINQLGNIRQLHFSKGTYLFSIMTGDKTVRQPVIIY